MTKELSSAEKALMLARKEFNSLANKTTKALDREASKLRRQIAKLEAQLGGLVDRVKAGYERLEDMTAPKAKRKLRAQLKKYEKMQAAIKTEVAELREDLKPVADELKKSRFYKRRANEVDRLFKSLERGWAALTGKKKKKKTAKRKTTAKKRAAAKRAPVKERAAKKKKPARRKVVRKKTPVAKRKVARKKPARRKKPAKKARSSRR